MKEKTKGNLSVREMAVTAVMAAVMCVLGPLSLPLGPVPVTLTNLAVYFALYVLGAFRGTVSLLLYLLIGLTGLPVFSGFSGGAGKLLGPTGGYLIGFIPMAVIAGLVISRFAQKKLLCIGGMVLGTAVCYGFGSLWLAWQAGMDLQAALAAGVIPFIPVDLIKILLAALVGPELRKRLKAAGLDGSR